MFKGENLYFEWYQTVKLSSVYNSFLIPLSISLKYILKIAPTSRMKMDVVLHALLPMSH